MEDGVSELSVLGNNGLAECDGADGVRGLVMENDAESREQEHSVFNVTL